MVQNAEAYTVIACQLIIHRIGKLTIRYTCDIITSTLYSDKKYKLLTFNTVDKYMYIFFYFILIQGFETFCVTFPLKGFFERVL